MSESKKEAVTDGGSQSKQEAAEKVIQNHVLGTMGFGLIPIPLVDLVGITGVQTNMIRKLALIYEIPFMKEKVKNLVTPLVGGALPVFGAQTMISLFKAIPVIGQTTGALAVSITSGAVTYAIGKVFLQHFASGGTFLTFDPDKVKEYYEQMFKEGKKVAADLKEAK